MARQNENFRKANIKRKHFSRGFSKKFKRFKREPKFIRDNVENQIAKEKDKDVYHFSDSDEEEDRANELGMGLEISDLIMMSDNTDLDQSKAMLAMTQDTVAPLFKDEADYDDTKLTDALHELKYTQFRPNQKETIKRILMGRSTLFISPTGSGKSLCYQLPALLYSRYRKYITIIISPLISLMEDQVRNIPPSLKAITLNSTQNRQQRQNSIKQLVDGEAQLAFISPEAIVGGILELDDLKNLPAIGFICIDEAHCLSEWSHNFRPAYLQFMNIIREKLNVKTFLALTATATKATVFGIARALTINPETDVIGETKIPDNLILSISYETNKELALINLLKSPTFRILPSIIVYCDRRDETERVAATIRTAMQNYSSLIEVPERVRNNVQGGTDDGTQSSPETTKQQMRLAWNAEAYHAGLPQQARNDIQRRFIKGQIRVVVATIAFGLGINKANIRSVIHYDMPGSFESYVQEIGRAGRDGKPAQCHMFLRADKSDVFVRQRNIYTFLVEKSDIERLSSYIFKPCRCQRFMIAGEQEKLDRLNAKDTHEVTSWYQSKFTDTPVDCNEDDLEEHELLKDLACEPLATAENDENTDSKENQPTKYMRKSVVRKHRPCKGHEVGFSIADAIQATNLSQEAIMTFICQLQRAYPQLKIELYAPVKAMCTLFCYKGPQQMEQLAKTCPAVRVALFQHKMDHNRTHGKSLDYEVPKKLRFDMISVARDLAKTTNELIRMLKQTEWELNDETGRFRRTHIRVAFEENYFFLTAVGDLAANEMREINEFLTDHMRRHIFMQRNKVFRLYRMFVQHSVNIDQMNDKIVRLKTSMRLKSALNGYFNPSLEQYALETAVSCIDNDRGDLSAETQQAITRKARDFLSKNGDDFCALDIAKIFQGIPSPRYPADCWGNSWWRSLPNVDFLRLQEILFNFLV